jgi:putative cardiolipin synthase
LDNLEKLPTVLAVDPSLQTIEKEDNYYIHAIESGTLPFSWAKAHLIADHPDKILQKRYPKQFIKQTEISHYIDKVKKELLIFTPYLVPTATGIQYFKRLKQRGVRIILFTNSLATTDVPLVHSGYMNYRHALVELGVELYELKHVSRTFDLFKQLSNGKKVKVKKDSLHAKVMVFDRQAFYVGSMNIDPRSISENTELGLVIESAKVANSIYTWFEKNINQLAYRITLKDLFSQGKQVVWQSNDTQQFLINEPHTSLSRRVWMDFLRGLPIAEKHL